MMNQNLKPITYNLLYILLSNPSLSANNTLLFSLLDKERTGEGFRFFTGKANH